MTGTRNDFVQIAKECAELDFFYLLNNNNNTTIKHRFRMKNYQGLLNISASTLKMCQLRSNSFNMFCKF